MVHCTFFTPEELALLSLFDEIKLSPDRKMIKHSNIL